MRLSQGLHSWLGKVLGIDIDVRVDVDIDRYLGCDVHRYGRLL